MKQVWAKDVVKGMSFTEEFLITNVMVRPTKAGNSKFATFKASDKTGTLDCIMFSYGELDNGSLHIQEGRIVTLTGTADEYNGKPNFKVSVVSQDNHLPRSNFEKASEYDPNVMWEDFVEFFLKFEDNWFRDVAMEIFGLNDLKDLSAVDAFKISPAATGLHHAFRSGLLEHTLEMLEIGYTLLGMRTFKKLNRDLCLFGLMFHDFGKIFEYSSEAGFKRTVQGVLVPHIPMTGGLILEAANKFKVPEIVRDHMMHVVLAHHRRLEWGSPVTFSCPEAAFVHYVDNMHGDVHGILQKRAQAQPGEEIVKYGFGADTCNVIVKSFNDILKDEREALNEAQFSTGNGGEKTFVDGF